MRFIFGLVFIVLYSSPALYAQINPTDSDYHPSDSVVLPPLVAPLFIFSLDSVAPAYEIAIGADTLLIRKDTLVLIGVGDIMMGTNYPDDSRLPPRNGAHLMRDVEDVLGDADLTIGNLEGVLLDSGGTVKSCKDPKVCYAFRSPVSYVENLVRAGFDIMSLANNHAGDFGNEGRRSSIQTLDSVGIAHAGQLTHPYTFYTRDNITYGFTAFAPNSGCVSLNDVENARS